MTEKERKTIINECFAAMRNRRFKGRPVDKKVASLFFAAMRENDEKKLKDAHVRLTDEASR